MTAQPAPFVTSVSEINFANAEAIKREGLAYLASTQGVATFDLGHLRRANSVTVAVMVGWYRAASLQTQSIVFVNLSQELRNIIAFSGLSSILLH